MGNKKDKTGKTGHAEPTLVPAWESGKLKLRKNEQTLYDLYNEIWGTAPSQWVFIGEQNVKFIIYRGRSYYIFASLGLSERRSAISRELVQGRDAEDLRRVEFLGYMNPDWNPPTKVTRETKPENWFIHGLVSLTQFVLDEGPFIDDGTVIPNLCPRTDNKASTPFGHPFFKGTKLSHWCMIDAAFNDPRLKEVRLSTGSDGEDAEETQVRFFLATPITRKESDIICEYGYENFDQLTMVEIENAPFDVVANADGRECLVEFLEDIGVDKSEMQHAKKLTSEVLAKRAKQSKKGTSKSNKAPPKKKSKHS